MLDRLIDGWAALVEGFYGTQFGAAERIQFYESMTALLENGVGVDEALSEVGKIYSDDGHRPHHPITLACTDMGQQFRNGSTLSKACSDWMPYQEQALISAGERSGNLTGVFSECVRLIETRQKLKSLILGASVYPAFIWGLMVYLLHVIASRVVPAMTQVSPPEHMSGAPYLLYLIATYVDHYGLITLIVLITVLAGSLVSLPYLTGPLRIRLEQLPPWSIYKALHGSTFLLNIAIMLRANINQLNALDTLLLNAKPWLRERLEAVSYGVEIGKDFGMALQLAGHQFPDKTAIRFLRILATRKSFPDAIHRFSNRWLDTTIKRVGLFSKILLLYSSVAIGALMILVMVGTYGMQTSISSSLAH